MEHALSQAGAAELVGLTGSSKKFLQIRIPLGHAP